MPSLRLMTAGSVGAFALTIGSANAAVFEYFANLIDLNGLGASGQAQLTLDDTANTLTVNIQASGLDPNVIHVQHIHGRVDAMGNPLDSMTPTAANDTDGDGFIELAEGVPAYGPILLALSSPAGLDPLGTEGGFPTAPDGTIDFSFTYDLNDPSIFAAGFTVDQLLPLVLREIVIHGAILAQGDGSNGGEADGTAGFKATLPVLAGEINEVPIPGAAFLLLSGLAGLPLLRRKKSAAV